MKTGTVTFHSAHNYGAMLQSYALQQFLLGLGVENELINLRIDANRHLYQYPSFDIYPNVRKLFHLFDVLERRKKYFLFESFLKEDLILSKEYSKEDELSGVVDEYDVVITGGDQAWNPNLIDWSPAYFLPFPFKNKISFAVSLGAEPETAINGDLKGFIGKTLSEYDRISVRDIRSANAIKNLYGLNAEVHMDTVFLLDAEEWEKKLEKSTIRIKGFRYLMMYTPSYNAICDKVGIELGEKLNLKVITTTLCPLREKLKNRNLHVRQKAGPWEFLWMIKNSDFVLCRSFHAVVFSLIFHRPFFFLDFNCDSRVHGLLEMVGLENRIVTLDNYLDKVGEAYNIDFSYSDEVISKERERSRNYLIDALELSKNGIDM